MLLKMVFHYADLPHKSIFATQKYVRILELYIFDDCLEWCTHVATFCKTASFLFRVTSHERAVPSEVIKMLMEPLVLSHFVYALPVWAGSYVRSVNFSLIQHLYNWGYVSLHLYGNITMYLITIWL